MNDKELYNFFTIGLLKWDKAANTRQMPWKGEKDPYKIWLSEIILQQTRVEQGTDYYNRFIKAYPTVDSLAGAKDEKVFKLWEGLGYYSRCKNLLASARMIAGENKGVFPADYESIRKLKGVGPYTAAAIASFAFDLPHAVVDGNVYRVLSRFFGIDTPIDSTTGKKLFGELAETLLEKRSPGKYNQALMDFGAVICKPQKPLCTTCPLKKNCRAFISDKVNDLPVKCKSLAKKTRWFYYLEARYEDSTYTRVRSGKDIWQNLYEFILVEKTEPLDPGNINPALIKKMVKGIPPFRIGNISEVYRQQLTHQTINGLFIRLELSKPLEMPGYEPVRIKKLRELPFPKLIVNYLTEKKLTLNLQAPQDAGQR